MNNKVLYGIEEIKTHQLLKVSVSGTGDAEDCNSYEAELNTYGDTIYLVNNEEIANKVLKDDIGWYNSSLEHPQKDKSYFNEKTCRVVKVELTFGEI